MDNWDFIPTTMALIKKTTSTRSTAFAIDQSVINVTTVDISGAHNPRISNVAEVAIDPALGELQLKAIVKNHRLPKQAYALCLDLDEYQLVPMDAPDVPEEELADALKWAVTEFVEKPIDDMVIDFFDVPNSSNRSDIRHINVVVADKVTIKHKAEQFKHAGLKLGIIDIPELAIRNLVNHYHLDEEGVVFLYLNKKSGLLVFVHDKQIYFSRKLEIGSEVLLQSPDKRQDIALEIQRSLDYIDRYFNNVKIKRMVVAPTLPALRNLATFLDKTLAISCVDFEFNRHLDWNQTNTSDISPATLLSLGAALRVDEEE